MHHPTATADDFRHEAFLYRDEDEFLAGLVPFVRDGLAQGEAVVVAEPRPRLDLLRAALGPDAAAVEFFDMAEVGANPARIIPVWQAAVDRHLGAGRGLRGVGEPAFAGRRPAEFAECELHELLLNEAFDPGPGWWLLCPYDRSALPEEVCTGALAGHTVWSTPTSRGPTGGVEPARIGAAFAAPLAPRAGGVLRGRFGPDDVPAVRHTVAAFAATVGLPPDRGADLALAATELASNSLHHGGGSGTVAMWVEPGAAILEFADAGRLTDPLTGRRRPSVGDERGRGLYLVNHLCDLVQLRSSAAGTTVRVTSWLEPPGR